MGPLEPLVHFQAFDDIKRDTPLVSIIIVSYGSGKILADCIESILGSHYSAYEIIIVENNSQDTSTNKICQRFVTNEKIRVIHNQINLGYAGGCNAGYRQSKGEIIVFLNPDTKVTSDWLDKAINQLTDHQQIGALQFLLMQLSSNGIDSAGQRLDYLGYGYPLRNSPEGDILPTFYADGAAFIVSRRVLDLCAIENRPFDQDYFSYYEDNDLSWRIRLLGYDIGVSTSSIVYHDRLPARAAKMSTIMEFHHTKNRFQTLMKNYSILNVIRFVPALAIMEFIRAIYMLSKKPGYSKAILSAMFWVCLNLSMIAKKRSYVQKKIRKVKDDRILSHMIKVDMQRLRRNASEYYGE